MRNYFSRFLAWIKTSYKTPEFWLRVAAYGIPLAFLLYVLYWNFLPFGYNKTFTIQVGGPNDTSGEFYLEPSRNLSERKTASDGTTYRELNGTAYAVFKPKAVLKDAKITVSVEGEGVSIIPPQIDFDPDSVQWDYSWDFSKEIPSDLKGNAFHFDDCAYFDGKSKLELPDSADKFEDGPFTVYAEWMPKDDQHDFQEIVGHYNWELLQNKDSVSFQVGRMNDASGPFYSINYPVANDFFSEKHYALAIYSPSQVNGIIDLFIDGKWAGRNDLGSDAISQGYNRNVNLTLGKASHGVATYLKSCVSDIRFTSMGLAFQSQQIILLPPKNQATTTQFIVPLSGIKNSLLKNLHAKL